jgi:hypothetical protein
MVLISHRGNIKGECLNRENSPEYINEALSQGFEVEIDVWLCKNQFYLGHDKPQYEVNYHFISRKGVWCHAKNFEALVAMKENNAHCFWHQDDDYTLTSKGFIWTYPNKLISSNSVLVCRSMQETKKMSKESLYGICSEK